MTRLLIGLMLMPFLIPALLWALSRLVHWPEEQVPDKKDLYRERSERLRSFIAMRAPSSIVYAAARLLLATQYSSTWRAIVAWALEEVQDAIEWRLSLAHVRWYALTHRCSWEEACDALDTREDAKEQS